MLSHIRTYLVTVSSSAPEGQGKITLLHAAGGTRTYLNTTETDFEGVARILFHHTY